MLGLGLFTPQGPFMAFRVRDEVRLHPEYHEIKEDVQYSLIHCELDDKALRLNGLGVKWTGRMDWAKPYGASLSVSNDRNMQKARA